MQLKESVDTKINASMWFHCITKNSVIEDKRKYKEAHLSEFQKACPTSEFVIVM